jgi:hypothetical protein
MVDVVTVVAVVILAGEAVAAGTPAAPSTPMAATTIAAAHAGRTVRVDISLLMIRTVEILSTPCGSG